MISVMLGTPTIPQAKEATSRKNKRMEAKGIRYVFM